LGDISLSRVYTLLCVERWEGGDINWEHKAKELEVFSGDTSSWGVPLMALVND